MKEKLTWWPWQARLARIALRRSTSMENRRVGGIKQNEAPDQEQSERLVKVFWLAELTLARLTQNRLDWPLLLNRKARPGPGGLPLPSSLLPSASLLPSQLRPQGPQQRAQVQPPWWQRSSAPRQC